MGESIEYRQTHVTWVGYPAVATSLLAATTLSLAPLLLKLKPGTDMRPGHVIRLMTTSSAEEALQTSPRTILP